MIDSLKDLNVLYVDDDKVACKNMQNTLSYFFKEVFIEHNGLEALETYKTKSIHLLLVDYDMPVMNGADFLKEIRNIDNTIPAVIISSYSDKEKLMSAIKLNLVSYLTKPLEFSALKNLLQECALWMEKYNLLKVELEKDCFYDISSKVIFENNEIKSTFTNYESKIFEYLLKNKEKVVSFDKIFNILDNQEANKKSLTSIIYKINKKLPKPIIKNVKDIGYILAGI